VSRRRLQVLHQLADRTLITGAALGLEMVVLSLYRRCDFNCAYCCTAMQGVATPLVARDELVGRLRAELAGVPHGALVSVGGIRDAYPRPEAELGLARLAIEELVTQRRPFGIVTKNPLVCRDADLLAGYDLAHVTITVTTLDEAAVREVESDAPSAADRLAAAMELRRAGANVIIAAGPWLPDHSDAEALIDAVDGRVPIMFGVLDVTGVMAASLPFCQGYDQREVNERYLREYVRIGERPMVGWRAPVPLAHDDVGNACASSLSYVEARGRLARLVDAAAFPVP
jgi:DNA repair photolyase